MANFPISGYATYLAYGWESTFGTASGTYNKAFSQGVKITAYDIDNSPDYVYQIGSQDVQASVAKQFKGNYSLEFNLSDPWWLKGILGGPAVTQGAGPYTHSWSGSAGITNLVSGLTLDIGVDMATDSRQLLTGSITNTMTLTAAVNEPVKVKLDGWFSNMTKSASLGSAQNPVESPLEFQHVSVQFPSATTLVDVQSVELSFNRNIDPVYGLGSRFPQNNVPKTREWVIRLKATYEDDASLWDDLLGSSSGPTASPAEIATLVVTISNGLTSTNIRSFTFTFANVFVEKGSLPITPDDVTMVDVTLRARSVTGVQIKNNTSAAL